MGPNSDNFVTMNYIMCCDKDYNVPKSIIKVYERFKRFKSYSPF